MRYQALCSCSVRGLSILYSAFEHRPISACRASSDSCRVIAYINHGMPGGHCTGVDLDIYLGRLVTKVYYYFCDEFRGFFFSSKLPISGWPGTCYKHCSRDTKRQIQSSYTMTILRTNDSGYKVVGSYPSILAHSIASSISDLCRSLCHLLPTPRR